MRESLNSPREVLLGQLKIFCSFCSWAIIVSQVQMMFLIIPRRGEPNLINSGESIAFKHPLSLTSKRIQSLGLCFKQTPGWCQGCWYEHPLASKMPAETQCLSLFSVDLYLQLKVPVCHCGKVKDEGVWNSFGHIKSMSKREQRMNAWLLCSFLYPCSLGSTSLGNGATHSDWVFPYLLM